MDETGFVINPRLEKVIAQKGARQVHKVAHGNSYDHITVVPTLSAAGTYIPPLIIYKGSRAIPGLLEGAPAGTVMGFTESGYMRENLFQKYIEHFCRSIPPTRPVMLMLDGHKSHINYASIDFCHKNGILLYALPPNTTHVLQPCELPFAKLKKEYDKSCEKFRINSGGELVTKYTFAKVLGSAFTETYTPSAICNAFKVTGIWPLNPNAISSDHLNPSLLTERLVTLNSQVDPIPKIKPTPAKPVHSHFTRANSSKKRASLRSEIESLGAENELLKTENESLRNNLKVLQEKLEVFKNPGTCNLRLALKYPLPRKPQLPEDTETDAGAENLSGSQPSKKRRKTIPFAQLLTNEESLQQLKDAQEQAVRKVEEKKQKKEEAAKKKVAREQERAKKQEESKYRREKCLRKKEERPHCRGKTT